LENIRDGVGEDEMDGLLQDLRYGWRMLRARPGLAIVAVLTLGLGIGANTAIFSAVNALLLRPVPVEDEDRLVFGVALREGFDPFGTSFLEYGLYRDEGRSLAGSGLGTARQFNLRGWGEPERLRGAAVMAGYLSTLGVKPALGRVFTPEEDRPGGPDIALIGHDLWRRRFGGDRGVIGRALDLEGRPYSIVGVMPPGFDMPYLAEVWVPMQLNIDTLPLDRRAATANEFVARLRPGVTLHEADAELKTLARRLEREYPQIRRGWSYAIVSLRQQLLADLQGRTRRSLVALVVAVGFLLLICCANVAGLLLVRGVAREGEVAIRLSLGAGRRRLVRQLLTESLLLALVGGAAGVLLAFWIQPLLSALSPIRAIGLGPYLTDFRVDGRVLLFSLVLTLLTGAIFGLVPAVKAARSNILMGVLKRREQRAGAGAAGRRSLGMLVIGEIAVAVTLLIGGGLMVQSFRRLQQIDLGFRPEDLLTMELSLSVAKYPDPGRQARFMDQVLERVRALPGVVSAGMTTDIPLQAYAVDSVFEVEGRPRANPAAVSTTAHRMVSPGYLETLGVTLLKGRLLDERDRAGGLPVAVVSEELVRQAWPGEDPIGKRIRRVRTGQGGPWMTVVGLLKDVKEDRFNFRIPRPAWYVPFEQQALAIPVGLTLNLVVKTGAAPAAGAAAGAQAPDVAAAVRRTIHAVDPDQPVANVMPMTDTLCDLLTIERFSAVTMGALAALGLLLAALGLYGVMAYSVSQRTGEIGLRMALGARPRDVLRLVIGQGVALVAIGLALGVAGAWTLARLLSTTLYQVGPGDPATFAVVALTLAGAAFLACWLPARRATLISPMLALRCE
jgi:putative ABC transport system permease protein